LKKKKDIYNVLGAVIAVTVLYLIFHITGIGCPIHFLTGISCPGCGMTRAVFALLRLRFTEAFYYHPLVYALPLAVIVYILRKRIPKNAYRALIFTFIALFIIIYAIRIINPENGVLEFKPENGMIMRVIKTIAE